MSTLQQIRNCEGFEIKDPIEGLLTDTIDVLKFLCTVGELQLFPLFPIRSEGRTHCYRKFFWVDGEYVMRLQLFKADHCEDEKRVIVRIVESKGKELFKNLKSALELMEIEKSGSNITVKDPAELQKTCKKIKNIIGDDVFDPLLQIFTDEDILTRWKVLRILSQFDSQTNPIAIYNTVQLETEEALIDEFIQYIGTRNTSDAMQVFIQIVKENLNPYFRRRVIDGVPLTASESTRGLLRDIVEFDPDTLVRDSARKALQTMM